MRETRRESDEAQSPAGSPRTVLSREQPAGAKTAAEAPTPRGGSPLSRFRRLGLSWFFGLLVLAAVMAAVMDRSEIANFAAMARDADPLWLLAGFVCQVATYVCAAMVWHLSLRRQGVHRALATIVPLGLAKLFTDQVLPMGGISGNLLVLHGLARRGIPTRVAMAALLVGIVTYYSAYLALVVIGFCGLWLRGVVSPVLLAAAAIFLVLAFAVPVLVLTARRWAGLRVAARFRRIPEVNTVLTAIAEAPPGLLRDPALMGMTIGMQLMVFLLDSATLWFMLRAIGHDVPPLDALASFMMASVASTIGPVPLGLGTFEGTAIVMLVGAGVRVEAALAATLLLRGLTFWLPMIPGMLLARRELQGDRADGSQR